MNREKLFNYATGLPRTFLGRANVSCFLMFMLGIVGIKGMVPALGMLILLKEMRREYNSD